MGKRHFRQHNAAVILITALLGLYLIALIGFAYVTQQRLHDTLLEQDRIDIENQATALRYFFEKQQETLKELSALISISRVSDRQRQENRPRPFSTSELMTIGRLLVRAIKNETAISTRIFRRITFTDDVGNPLVTASRDGTISITTGSRFDVTSPAPIQVKMDDGEATLQLTDAVTSRDGEQGHLFAEIPAQTVLQPFLSESTVQPSGPAGSSRQRQSAVVDSAGRVVAQSHAVEWQTHAQQARQPPIDVAIPGTNLRLLAHHGEGVTRDATTSLWVLVAMALIALPLLFGAAHIWRLHNHHLVLRTRFLATKQQRERLRKQNARLRSEIDRRVASEKELVYQANYDQLTGLPNRNLALDRLEQALKWAKREGTHVLVLFIDLDRFKQVNDSLGHAAGDDLLREAAHRLQAKVRDRDTVARLGGDEFLVLCTDVEDADAARNVAQSLLKALATPFQLGEHEFFIGGSIGVSVYPEGGEDPLRLMKNADIAMYAAKASSRNTFKIYDPTMDAAAMETMRIERKLRHALDNEEFYLLYQPIVGLSSGHAVAVEALLRWQSDEMGDIPPCRFIPIAEETGLIHDIGEWVLREACQALSQLQHNGSLRVAVNLSSTQFSHPKRLLDCVLDTLRTSGLMPEQLEIEITESILLDDRLEVIELMHQLDRIGVRLSLDDFGTGYSALNYLQRFPFDVLKIDRSFTARIGDNDSNAALIRAIIAMAHALDLEVIAEGIEHRSQAGFLLVQHCEFGQGFLYSQPLTSPQLCEYLEDDTALAV